MNKPELCLRAEKPHPGIEYVFHGDTMLALIISSDYKADGISFFTPGSFSQQLGYMRWPKGHIIEPHDHNPVARTVEWTQETLVIRKGRVRVDFYMPSSREFLGSRELHSGDIILLAHGGHGFEMMESGEIVEIKQGPYAGDADKTRFKPQSGPMSEYRVDG